MLDSDELQQAAEALDDAERASRTTRQLTQRFPGITVDDAYEVQRRWVAGKVARGRKPIGHKIGLTSRAMQQDVGVDEPDYGVLLDDMRFEERDEIPCSRFIGPRVELEVAFILGKDLAGEQCSIIDVLDATRYVVPSVEIIDSRVERKDAATGVNKKIADNIADNAGNAALVLGTRLVDPRTVDLRWIHALGYRNGQIEESGVAAAVMNSPLTGVAWLVRKLARHGDHLKAGEIVLSGSFTRPIPARPGDVFHLDFHDFGSVSCRFG